MSTSKEEPKTNGTTFTEKELLLLQACFKYGQLDNVDFEKVATHAGYKDANIAKVMFRRLKAKKIEGGDGADNPAPAPKTPTKPRATRVTKTKKTPTKSKAKVDPEESEEEASAVHKGGVAVIIEKRDVSQDN